MKTIIFDESCVSWTGDPDFDRMLLDSQIDYLKDLCRFKGYLYLDKVYDTFGVAWNPDDDNVCYRQNNGGIDFEVEPINDGKFLIHIS